MYSIVDRNPNLITNLSSTSPSIYARFNRLWFEDLCGLVTTSNVMLSFTPGELSTLAGPLQDRLRFFRPDEVRQRPTRAFNPADLPCPPQSVMEEVWYSPEPGVPYRPLVMFPDQIRSSQTSFPGSLNFYFAPIDPPYALTAQNAITPDDPEDDNPARFEEPAGGDALTTTSNDLIPLPKATPAPVPKGTKPTSVPKDPNMHDASEKTTPNSSPTDPQKDEEVRQGYSIVSQHTPNPGEPPHVETQSPGEGFAAGPDSIPVSPSGVRIFDESGQLIAADKIYQVPPKALTTAAEGSSNPMTITLPDGANAVLLPPMQGSGKLTNPNGNSHDKNSIDGGNEKGDGSFLSLYGTTLTPGGDPVTLSTGSVGLPLTLSFDLNDNIIYNPRVYTLPTILSQSSISNSDAPAAAVTTEILGHGTIVVLPNGGGVSIAGTTLYPSSLLASLTTINGKAEMMLSGTRNSLLGTSALVIGTLTVSLPIPPVTTTNAMMGADTTNSSGPKTNQGIESFTGVASPTTSLYKPLYGLTVLLTTAIALALGT